MWSGRTILCCVLVASPGAELQDCMQTVAYHLEILPDETFRHASTEVLYQQSHTAILRERKVWKLNIFTHIKGSEGTDRLNPSAVHGPIISLSLFIWADRLLGHSALAT
jgi:hypothetical protein